MPFDSLASAFVVLEVLAVVAFVILWWFARKDITERVAGKHAPTVAELEKVRASIEDLLDTLEERASSVERRLSALIEEARSVQSDAARVLLAPPVSTQTISPTRSIRSKSATSVPVAEPESDPLSLEKIVAPTVEPGLIVDNAPEMPDMYREVYALSDSGIEDTVEIARRTGLGQAEVEMVISLRSRGA